jgi:CheY-like chemotaxis protein
MNPQPVDILLVEDNLDHVELILRLLRDDQVRRQVHLVQPSADSLRVPRRFSRPNGPANAERTCASVYLATSGEEALDFLYQRGEHADAPGPGLILLDIKLSKVDGLEVLRRIKANPKLKSIPVVMLTTSSGDEEMVESYRYGANSYIVKPVTFERFATAIKDLKAYWLSVSSLNSHPEPALP